MPLDRLPTPPKLRVALVLLIVVAATGCAVPGEPTARHPVTPARVTDLSARQLGDAVVLNFTLPHDSTDQKPLPSIPSIEVYRSTLPPGPTPAAKTAARLVDTIPGNNVDNYTRDGHVEFPDALAPADLARAPGQQIVYWVRTRVSAKRASLDSNAVTLHVFPTAEPIGDLRGTVTESAILLAWAAPQRTTGGLALSSLPGASPALRGYHIYRAEVEPPGAAAAAPGSAKPRLPGAPVLLTTTTQPEYRDSNIVLDHAYSYIVRSVLQFGPDAVESGGSNRLLAYAKDVFPPATPRGLETIVVPASPGSPASVELTWGISEEPDLAGYIVYRSEQIDTAGIRLTPDLLSAPTFRDMTVVSGLHYFYRVAAVDRDGNQSPQSAAVEAVVPER